MSDNEYREEVSLFHRLRDDDYTEEDMRRALPNSVIYNGEEDDDNPQIPGFHDSVADDWQ